MAWLNGYQMEPVVFMPTTLAGHVAKHCNHVVNSPDENNISLAVCIDKPNRLFTCKPCRGELQTSRLTLNLL